MNEGLDTTRHSLWSENRGSDLQMVVMSATLLGGALQQQEYNGEEEQNGQEDDNSAGQKLLRALGGPTECHVLQSDGRQYPFEILWANQLSWTGTSQCPPLGALLRDCKSLVETMSLAIELSKLLPRAMSWLFYQECPKFDVPSTN